MYKFFFENKKSISHSKGITDSNNNGFKVYINYDLKFKFCEYTCKPERDDSKLENFKFMI